MGGQLMRRLKCLGLGAVMLAGAAYGAALPGFRLDRIATTGGFVTSLAFHPDGTLFYSTMDGLVLRLERTGKSIEQFKFDTAVEGNAALLGMAFRGDDEVVVHYVAHDMTADVVEVRSLKTGETLELHRFVCVEGRSCPSEHHGGNPIVAADGTIFVGIGDFGGGTVAQQLASPGGKIFRIPPRGQPVLFALGLRNPYDMALDASGNLIVADNGPVGEDEINVLQEGDNAGWPLTMGNQPPMQGMVAPVYTFPETVAPTGLLLTERGIFVGSFVTKALYYFPDLSSAPVEIFRGDVGMVLDVAENAAGELFVATPGAIFRLMEPRPGDADGNGEINEADLEAISREILDGDGNDRIRAQLGTFKGSWGADVNRDGVIDARDLVALASQRLPRNRAIRP